MHQKNSILKTVVFIELLTPMILLTLGVYHGLLQVLYRAGFIRAASFLGLEYYQGLTAHGVINAVVLTTFFAVAFGNVIVSDLLERSLHTIGMIAALVCLLLGSSLAAAAILAGKASVLYTFYPPLKAHPVFYIGLVIFVIGSWIAFGTYIHAYRQWRKTHPTTKLPLAVLGVISTFTIWQIATLPVAVEILALLLPWSLGLTDGVDVTLARTLFWFFGHPLVYFWLLPTYTLYYTTLPVVAGGKTYSDFAARLSFLLLMVLSAPLGLHHQYADPGIAAKWKALHLVLTSFVAIPSLTTAFSVCASLEHAARNRGGRGLFGWWKKLPYFDSNALLFPYLFCGLAIFVFGGATGIVNASYNLNLVVHNTAWVPAHFHMTVGGPVFLAILGTSLVLIAQCSGREVFAVKKALLVPYLWLVGILVFSGGLFIGGLQGEPRRTNMGLTYMNPDSPLYEPKWFLSTHISVVGGVIMAIGALLYFYSFFGTILAGKKSASTKLSLPQSEAIHNENISVNLTWWVLASIGACVISYGPPLYDLWKDRSLRTSSKPFTPDSPVAQ